MSATNCLFQFWTWRRNGIEFHASDCDLYYCLLDSSVRFGGGKFTLSNKWLCNLLSVSLRTLQSSRERLSTHSMISFENGKPGVSPTYEITDISGRNHPDDTDASSRPSSRGSSRPSSRPSSRQRGTKLNKSKSKSKRYIDIFEDHSLLPANLQGAETVNSLKQFLDHRSAKGNKPYTDMGLDRLLKQLSGWEDQAKGKAADSLEHSILNNWNGVFEKKDSKVQSNSVPKWKLDSIIQELQDELMRTYPQDARDRISARIKEYKRQKEQK